MAKLQYTDYENIRIKDKLVKSIGYKPVVQIFVTIFISGLLILTGNLYMILLAVFFLLMAGFIYYLVKERKTLDIYESGIVLYASDDQNKAVYIPFEDIKEWTAKRTESGADAMFFLLQDDTHLYKDTFQASKAYRAINKLIPEKESKAIMLEKNKDKPFQYPKAVKKFINRLKKK